jgi:putative protease
MTGKSKRRVIKKTKAKKTVKRKVKAVKLGRIKKPGKITKIKKSIRATKEKRIGEITHYFSNIEVAVINLATTLKKGDKIKIVGGEETDFEQKVDSMQIEYKEVKSAKKGASVGLKVKEKVREGYKVFKV